MLEKHVRIFVLVCFSFIAKYEDETMTRKDYELIAKVIKVHANFKCTYTDQRKVEMLDLAIDLAVYFQEENPRFDPARFLKACGIED